MTEQTKHGATVRIDNELHTELKNFCRDNDLRMSVFVGQLIKQGVIDGIDTRKIIPVSELVDGYHKTKIKFRSLR